MMRFHTNTRRSFAGLIVLGSLAIGLGGCAAGAPTSAEDADLDAGKQSFVASCGACHALDDAGTTSQIGPNLDDAFRGSRQQGIKESAFSGVVKQWIERPQPPMAPNLVTGVDADNVAAYVGAVAGQSQDSSVRAESPFVIRPPVPGGIPVDKAPPVLEEGQIVSGQPEGGSGGKAPPEGEGG